MVSERGLEADRHKFMLLTNKRHNCYKSAMEDPFLEQFQAFLVDGVMALKQARNAISTSKARMFYDIRIETFEKFLLFINKYKQEDMQMPKGTKIEFGDLLDIEALPKKESENSIKALIKKEVPTIPKGKMKIVKVSSGKWQTVTNAMSALKTSGEIDKAFRAAKRGEEIFLIHE